MNNNNEMKSNVFSDYGNTNNLNTTPNNSNTLSSQNIQNNQNIQNTMANQILNLNQVANNGTSISNNGINNMTQNPMNQNTMSPNVNNSPINNMNNQVNMARPTNQMPTNQIINTTTTASVMGSAANNQNTPNTQGTYFNQVQNNQPINTSVPNTNQVNPNQNQANQISVNQDLSMPKLNTDETVGMMKKDTQKSPVAMLILFACLIIGIFVIPYITPYLSDVLKIFGIDDNSSIYGDGKDTTSNTNKDNNQDNVNKDNTSKDNDTKETTYYDILDTTAITFNKLIITNLTKTEENGAFYLNYKITNNDNYSYNFRTHKIYFDLYNDSKTYIGRVLIYTDSLSSKEEITLKSILNENEYTAATKLEVLERTTADYQSITLKNNKLTCNGNNHSTIYTFTSNKLTGIDDTYNYTFVVNDEAYAQYALNVQNTVNDLNKITGVSAGFVNTQTGFTKTMKINYSETSENLTKYDRIYYEKDATASTVKYELESIGYKCD